MSRHRSTIHQFIEDEIRSATGKGQTSILCVPTLSSMTSRYDDEFIRAKADTIGIAYMERNGCFYMAKLNQSCPSKIVFGDHVHRGEGIEPMIDVRTAAYFIRHGKIVQIEDSDTRLFGFGRCAGGDC